LKYLIDTCVISELIKVEPHETVVTFLQSLDESKLFISSMTLGELHKGIQKLVESKKRSSLLTWINGIEEQFDDRILSFNKDVSILWGQIMAQLENNGYRMSAFDSIICATGMYNNCCLITRNVKDFEKSGIEIINPWEL
jgi:predicted nucleic acid-binding protein